MSASHRKMTHPANIRRSREQCKLACDCRGATVYVDEVQIAQKPRAMQMSLLNFAFIAFTERIRLSSQPSQGPQSLKSFRV